MRTITDNVPVYKFVGTKEVSTNVYQFSELSDDAKQVVREWWEKQRGYTTLEFSELCNDDLWNLFPNSDLKVQYELNYAQGDGLNVYGRLYIPDVIEHIKDRFSEEELAYFAEVFNDYDRYFYMRENWNYCYCICDSHEYTSGVALDIEYDGGKLNEDVLDKLNKEIQTYMSNLCSQYEKNGYDFFYPYIESGSDEYLISDCECNGWEFLGDGTLYEGQTKRQQL